MNPSRATMNKYSVPRITVSIAGDGILSSIRTRIISTRQADRKRKEDWLWADLAQQPRDRRVVVFLHKPPSIPFLAALGRYPVRIVMHGHWHSSKVFTRERDCRRGGTPPLCFGGLDTPTAGLSNR